MIQIHSTFVCKPGNAGKLAKMMKESMPFDPKKGPYILTDMTGQFHRVIMISNYDDLTAFEEDMKNMSKSDSPEQKKMMEAFKGMNDMYVSGSREIYKVW